VSELYEYIQGRFPRESHRFRGDVRRRAKPDVQRPPAKGLSLENDHMSELAWPFFAILGLLLGGLRNGRSGAIIFDSQAPTG